MVVSLLKCFVCFYLCWRTRSIKGMLRSDLLRSDEDRCSALTQSNLAFWIGGYARFLAQNQPSVILLRSHAVVLVGTGRNTISTLVSQRRHPTRGYQVSVGNTAGSFRPAPQCILMWQPEKSRSHGPAAAAAAAAAARATRRCLLHQTSAMPFFQ